MQSNANDSNFQVNSATTNIHVKEANIITTSTGKTFTWQNVDIEVYGIGADLRYIPFTKLLSVSPSHYDQFLGAVGLSCDSIFHWWTKNGQALQMTVSDADGFQVMMNRFKRVAEEEDWTIRLQHATEFVKSKRIPWVWAERLG